MKLYRVLYNGEPEPCAAFASRAPFIDAVEALEQMGELLLLYSFAVVLESDATYFFVIFEQGYVDVAPLGVGNGIFNFCVSQII